MIEYLALFLGLGYIIFLLIERIVLDYNRKHFTHIIHVNGIRGKSTVTRLIGAFLREAGIRTYTKVTGTQAAIIDCDGHETKLLRLGNANIKEQIQILRKAKRQKASVLVIECMALKKEYQALTTNRLLMADIGIITNIRKDHQEEYGDSFEQIAFALGESIPLQGRLFVMEDIKNILQKQINEKRAEVAIVKPFFGDNTIDFYPENIAYALAVASFFGIDEAQALTSMRNYQRDVGALAIYHYHDSYFVNGFALNDIDSIKITLTKIKNMEKLKNRPLTILINNRSDRPKRAMAHLKLIDEIKPTKLLVVGAYQKYFLRKLSLIKVERYKDESQLNEPLIFAIGNTFNYGLKILSLIEAKGSKYYG